MIVKLLNLLKEDSSLVYKIENGIIYTTLCTIEKSCIGSCINIITDVGFTHSFNNNKELNDLYDSVINTVKEDEFDRLSKHIDKLYDNRCNSSV